ncbi:hypothetical protein DS901_07470 [Loktanella sp. D2R18]|nr:hypothetical protein DS901_07470 [Loktanella sp. D2R18]
MTSTVPENPGSEKLWTQYAEDTYMRAGTVEALTSVQRGTGRSGTGETIFGRFGYDEEVIFVRERQQVQRRPYGWRPIDG